MYVPVIARLAIPDTVLYLNTRRNTRDLHCITLYSSFVVSRQTYNMDYSG